MTEITYDELLAKNPAVEQQIFNALFNGYWDANESFFVGRLLLH